MSEPRPRLLFYSDCYIFGGSENVLVNLIGSDALHERFDVHLAYAQNRDYERGLKERLPAVRATAVPILQNDSIFNRIDRRRSHAPSLLKLPMAILRRSGLYALFNFVQLYRLFRTVRPDVLHINNGGYPGAGSCLTAVFSAKAAGVRHVLFNVNNLARPTNKLVDRYLGRNVELFITASEAARATLPFERVKTIANAEPRKRVTRARDEVLAELGIPRDHFVIVTVAYLTERKGHRVLLDALRRIDGVTVIFVGEGEERAVLERASAGLPVIITGHRTDDYDFINAADLFVLPSLRDEDMPYVILSAMSLGKPIIATRVAGIPEEIRDGADGLIVEPGDAAALANAIETLRKDAELRARFGASAKARYEQLFTVERMTAEYMKVYDAILKPAGTRAAAESG